MSITPPAFPAPDASGSLCSAQLREDLSDRLINVGRDEGTTAHVASYLDGSGASLDNGITGLASFPESNSGSDSTVMLCAVEEEANPKMTKETS